MIAVLLADEWIELLDRARETGSHNEKLMASMLRDLMGGAHPADVFNAWAAAFLDAA